MPREGADRGPFDTALTRSLSVCRRHWRYAALFSALFNLLFLVPMIYLLQVYDRVVPTRGDLTLLFLTVFLVVALATMAVLDYARSRLLVRASVMLDRQMAGQLLEAALVTAQKPDDRVARRAMREFDTLRQVMNGPGALALFDAPWTPLYILVCFIIHPAIGALALGGSALLLAIAWRNEKRTRAPLDRASAAAAQAYASENDTLANAGVVKALGMRGAMIRRHIEERRQMMDEQTGASFDSSGLTAAAKFLRILLQSLALGLGAWLAIHDRVTPGQIFASMFLVGRALSPIDKLVASWKQIVAARGAYRTLEELLDRAAIDLPRTVLPAPTGALEIEAVSLASPDGRITILDGVSLSVRPGEAIAIIGPSGAGKSSLLSVIAGATASAEGQVRFDGAARRDWDSEALAAHIGFMPQHPTLFAGTVKENIARFGVAGEDIDRLVVEAARSAGAHDLIVRLPGGYDYRLGLGGSGLSMGQSQRIALARALFGNPRYLVLDEPNAHLDAEGDLRLVDALGDAKEKGTTILLVVHKLGILPVVDRVVLLRDGRIELVGPREEMLGLVARPRTRVMRHAAIAVGKP